MARGIVFWTPEKDALLRRCAAEGMSAHEAAKVVGRAESSCAYHARQLGVHLRKVGYNHYTPKEDETIRRMNAEGRGWKEIALYLGRSPGSVATRAQKMLGLRCKTAAKARKRDDRGCSGESKTRRCLCCGNDFESHGPGNRICNGCKTRSEFGSVLGAYA